MKHKIMLLALAAVSAAMFALPAMASANPWTISTPEAFSVTGGKTELTQDGTNVAHVTCTSVSGSGRYTTTSTGEVSLEFKTCTAPGPFGPVNCQSGATTGLIKTTSLTFHNIMLEPTPNGVPGVLITPNGTHFASFECAGLSTVEVTGNGIVGQVEKNCTESTKEAGLIYESSATGTQKWTQTETTGTKFDLDSKETNLFGQSVTRTASEDGTGTIKFANTQTINCA